MVFLLLGLFVSVFLDILVIIFTVPGACSDSLSKWVPKCSEYCHWHWTVQLFPNCKPGGLQSPALCVVMTSAPCPNASVSCVPVFVCVCMCVSFGFLTCQPGVIPYSTHSLLISSSALVLLTPAFTADSYYLITSRINNYTVSSFTTPYYTGNSM